MAQGRRRSRRRGWRQWREDEARAVLAELAASGESVAAFARRKGLSPQRLSYWRHRLDVADAVRFVPVALAAPSASSDAAIEILVRGVVIRARAEVEGTRVATLVAALAAALPPC